MQLTVLPGNYHIHRLAKDSDISLFLQHKGAQHFLSITQTDDEISIVCRDDFPIESQKNEKDWNIIKVAGPLDFSLTGILAKLSAIIAKIDVSVFVISTFDTDYILVKKENIDKVVTELERHDYFF